MEIRSFDGCDFQPTTVSRLSSGDNSEICGRSETFHQCPTNVILVAQILNSMGAKNRSQKESHTWDGYWSQTLVLINASVSSCGPGDKLCRSFGKLTHYSVTSYSAVVKRKAHPAARLGRRWAEVASRAAQRCSWTGLTRYSDARRTSWRQASGGPQELGYSLLHFMVLKLTDGHTKKLQDWFSEVVNEYERYGERKRAKR